MYPSEEYHNDLFKKWCVTGLVTNAKQNKQPSVRTPQISANIKRRIEDSPRKSI